MVSLIKVGISNLYNKNTDINVKNGVVQVTFKKYLEDTKYKIVGLFISYILFEDNFSKTRLHLLLVVCVFYTLLS